MTNKDAIEELKYSIEPNQGFMECRTGTISEEAIKIAIEALGKQIPKKPKYIGKINEDGNAEVECDCFASQDVAIKTIKRVYCWRCGQALDWSD